MTLRQTLRALAKTPGFTFTTVLTLAIGIGATTAIFSVVKGVLLNPLPFPDADRLIAVGHHSKSIGDMNASPALYLTYHDHNRTFESIALWWDRPDSVTGAGDPEQLTSLVVTNEFLSTLRVAPLLGRSFVAADDELGAPQTVILSYAYWQRRFSGAADVVGKSLTINGAPHTVIGVLPRSFRFLQRPAEILVPAGQVVRTIAAYGPMGERAIARLKPGVTLADVSADIERMIPIAIESYPGRIAPGAVVDRYEPSPRPLKTYFVGDLGNVLWVLIGTITMLLAVACANVANLQLARTDSRGQELAIRAALGASRGNLARSVLLESTVLGVAGGALGVGLATVALPMFLATAGDQLPPVLAIGIDPTVLAFAAAVSIASGLLFGSVAALKYGVARVVGALGGRAHSASRERHRARSSLVVAQVALALVLLVAAGLMIRTFDELRKVEPGFAGGKEVQTFSIAIPDTTPIDRVRRTEREIQARLSAVPGVESVGFQLFLPLGGYLMSGTPVYADAPLTAGTFPEQTQFRFTSPGFAETMRTPLIAGRTMTWDDLDSDRAVALVSAGLARSRWGSAEAALGKRLRFLPTGPWQEVIGVLGDVHWNVLEVPAQPTAYLTLKDPMTQWGITRHMWFAVRSQRAGTTSFAQELQRAVWSVDPSLPLAALETMDDIYSRSLARTSLTLTLLGIAGSMALALGLVGVYGVLTYMLAQRTREIGIRIALGAQDAAIKRLLLGQVIGLVGIGVALGLGGAAALTRFMKSLLFGVTALDLETYVLSAVALLAAAALAAYLPARRATRIDPMEALRAE